MEFIYITIALLLSIVLSDILHKAFTKIPIIFIQVLVGIVLSFFPIFNEFEFNSEIFMILIIKPLIFNEGYKLSIDELKEYFNPILSLSLFLVVVSVISVGGLLNLIIPQVPMSNMFILAAIVIPTNSGIVKSLSENLIFPKHTFHILEGESLFSDSIAMVLYELALAATLTREFDLHESIYEFVVVILGGIIVGAILGLFIIKLRYIITKYDFENPSMLVVIQIITPFVVFIIAEQYLHVSGIIAVIVAGIIHGIEKPLLNLKSTKLQVISESSWGVINYILEGSVAVLLGLVLPEIITNMIKYDLKLFCKLILLSVIVYLILISLRFFWVMVQKRKFILDENITYTKGSLLYALGGIHGTITLAIALAIPIITENGEKVFFRDELIFIAALVILISIVVPAILLKILLPKKDIKKDYLKFNQIRKNMIEYTINEIQNYNQANNDYAIKEVLSILRGQLCFIEKKYILKPNKDKIMSIIKSAQKVEINYVDELMKKGDISKEIGMFYKSYLKKSNNFGIGSALLNLRMNLIKRKVERTEKNNRNYKCAFIEEFNKLKTSSCKVAFKFLDNIKDDDNYKSVEFVREYYNKRIGREMKEFKESEKSQLINSYLLKVFQIENIFIKDSIEKGLISINTANQLREQISYDELMYLR